MCQDMGGVILVVVFGLPGAGKTSLCRALQAVLEGTAFCLQTHVVTFDDYDTTSGSTWPNNTEPCPPRFDPQAWKRGQRAALHALEDRLHATMKNEEEGATTAPVTVILVDDTFHLRSMRKRMISITHLHVHRTEFVFLDCPINLCIVRNAERPTRSTTSDVIRRNAAALEAECASWRLERDTTSVPLHRVPREALHAWERHPTCRCWRLVGSLPTWSSEALALCLAEHLFRPLHPEPVDTKAQPDEASCRSARRAAAETLHEELNLLDQALRRCVASVACQLEPSQLKRLSTDRKALLHRFRAVARSQSRESLVALRHETVGEFERLCAMPQRLRS